MDQADVPGKSQRSNHWEDRRTRSVESLKDSKREKEGKEGCYVTVKEEDDEEAFSATGSEVMPYKQSQWGRQGRLRLKGRNRRWEIQTL